MDGEIAKLEDTFITRTNNHYRTCYVNFHLEYIQTIKTAKTLTVSVPCPNVFRRYFFAAS